MRLSLTQLLPSGFCLWVYCLVFLRSLKTIQGSRKTSCRFRLSHFVNLSLTLVRLSGLSILPIRARPSGFIILLNSPDRTDLGYEDLSHSSRLPRKEVIQPHLPIRLPCYDFTPVIGLTLDGCLLAVNSPASGAPNSHGVTGGVYKTRERIHRDILIRDY